MTKIELDEQNKTMQELPMTKEWLVPNDEDFISDTIWHTTDKMRGIAIQFKTYHYMGLGTFKKKEWYNAYIRINTNTEVRIVLVNPIGLKLFASIPKEHIASGEFQIKPLRLIDNQGQETNVGIVNEAIVRMNVTNQESQQIWNDYFDREAIREILAKQALNMQNV